MGLKDDERECEPQYPSYISRNDFGKCLRAKVSLDKDIVVGTAAFLPTQNSFIAEHPDEEYKHVAIMGVTSDGKPIWGRVMGKMAYANHSCFPNCTLSSLFELITNRPVNQNEELTISYDRDIPNCQWDAKWNFCCACKSHNCRGYINKFQRVEISTKDVNDAN
jgi:hypothetical protein